MSEETLPLPQPRQKSREFLGITQIATQNAGVESDVNETDVRAENETDLSNIVSKKDNKDGKGLHLRLSKFLARNRCGKQPEEISIGSSKTADTRSSFSNESRIDYSKQTVSSSSSIIPRIGSQLKKLMKLKSQKEIKTEDEVSIIVSTTAAAEIPENIVDLEKENIIENAISESVPVVTSENVTIIDNTNEEESILSVQSDNENNPGIIIAENPHAVLITAAALTAQIGAPQAEVQIQTSRRNPRDIAATRTPYLFLQEDEPRVENYVQNMLGGERESITTGSESSSSISEVVDANEQPEGRDAAEQYYNAVLRAVIRKQFRHLDDEPPIY